MMVITSRLIAVDCRWADAKTQANNRHQGAKGGVGNRSSVKSHTIFVEIDGNKYCLNELARMSGRSSSTISRRYNAGIRGKDLLNPSYYYCFKNNKI